MSFQSQLHAEALRSLAGRETKSETNLGAENDTKVTFDPLELWIYEDGANLLGEGVDRRFEAPDFNSLDDLRLSVLAFLSTLIRPLPFSN